MLQNGGPSQHWRAALERRRWWQKNGNITVLGRGLGRKMASEELSTAAATNISQRGEESHEDALCKRRPMRQGRYAWHCVLQAIAGITALSASLLYSSTQRVVRNCAWPHKGASSQGRHHKGRIEKTRETCVCSPMLCSTPRSPPARSALSCFAGGADLRIKLPLKRERDSGTFATACLRRGSVQHASRGCGPGVCWRPSGQVPRRPATTSQTGPAVGQPAHFAGQAPPGNGGKRATQQQTQQF